jgi:hypothetical protein
MKTPITEIREFLDDKIQRLICQNSELNSKTIMHLEEVDSFLIKLLPKEKEVIEKAVFDTMAQGHMNLFMTNKIDKTEKEFFTNVAKTYFNETFTQK